MKQFIATLVSFVFGLSVHGQATCLPDANGDSQPFFAGMQAGYPVAIVNNLFPYANTTFLDVGDVTGDGHVDVAVTTVNANHDLGRVAIFRGIGDGAFAFNAGYSVNSPTLLTCVRIADMDGDSDKDLVVCNRAAHTVSVLLNSGTGQFGAPTNYTVNGSPTCVIVANLNRDSFLDVATLQPDTDKVSVRLGTGGSVLGAESAFQAGIVLTFEENGNAMYRDYGPYMDCGDIDNDGDVDLVMPVNQGVAVMLNSGNGAFGAVVTTNLLYPCGSCAPLNIALSDLDTDGKLDIVTADGWPATQTVSTAFGIGNGLFTNVVAYGVDFSNDPGNIFCPTHVSVGDFSGDGVPDVAVGQNTSPRMVLFTTNGATGALSPTEPNIRSILIGDTPWFPRVADVTGDGLQDILALTYPTGGRSRINAAINIGDGQFGTPEAIPPDVSLRKNGGGGVVYPFGNAGGMDAADIDGDGDLDLAMANGGHRQVNPPPGASWECNVAVARNTGGGVFPIWVAHELPHACTPTMSDGAFIDAIHFADLNGDSHPDIVVADAGCTDPTWGGTTVQEGAIWVLWNDGSGGYGTHTRIPTDDGGYGTRDVAMGDFDLDGDTDIAAVSMGTFPEDFGGPPVPPQPGHVRIYSNIEGGQFAQIHEYAISDPSNLTLYARIRAGHLDGDSRIDLVAFSGALDADVQVMLGQPGGQFLIAQSLYAWDLPCGMDLADLNGDDSLDLIVSNMQAGNAALMQDNIAVYFNDGSGLFGSRVNYSPPGFAGGRRVTAADVDLDGDIDVVVSQNFQGITVFLNDATGGLSSAVTYTVGNSSFVEDAQVADLDNDDDQDIFALDFSHSYVVILRNQHHCNVPPPPCPPDINNDGTVNIDDLVQVITNWGPCDIGPPPSPLRRAALGGPGSGPGSGDMNCDFATDLNDINPFMLALNDWKQYIQDYPDCDLFNGDMNNSGFPIDQADLAIFCPLAGGIISGKQCGITLPCPADINDDQVVNIDDLVMIITSWGPCEI